MVTKLPKLGTPTFTDKLISTGETFKYRSFVVGEESKLLLLKEGADEGEIYHAIGELIESCTFGTVDVSKLSSADIEHIFILLRKKSVGETVELTIAHMDSECEHRQAITLDLNEIEVEYPGGNQSGNIVLDEEQNVGIQLRHPNYSDISKIDGTNQTEFALGTIQTCTEYVFHGDEVYYLGDFSKEEVKEFFMGISTAKFEEISKFFSGTPKLVCNLKWRCDECGKDDEIKLEGLKNFL